MFDLHYDLLTNILMRKNDIKFLKKYCDDIYRKNNISGGIFNLFYMTPQEMKQELDIDFEDINIIKNLEETKKIIEQNQLIPKCTKYIFGIEGLDYLNQIEDVDKIYELGVRSVNIVWNNDNKFGGGIRADKNKGLTSQGRELVEKLVKTNIIIDLSHSNEKTFYDTINECKKLEKLGYKPKIMASHSNCKKICKVERNLTDEQILKIKELNGIVGIVSIKNFCTLNNKKNLKKMYIKHIQHAKEVCRGTKNIGLSTDDMRYYKIAPEYYKNINIFKQEKIKEEICELLYNEKYKEEQISGILEKNAIRLIDKNL